MKMVRIRLTKKLWDELAKDIRLGDKAFEGGRFLRCYWAEATDGPVVIVESIIKPQNINDVISGRWKITFQEEYVLNALSSAEHMGHAVGLVHSHPRNCPAVPSFIDDKMDGYFSGLSQSILHDAPYISFIVSKNEKNEIEFSGRVCIRGKWLLCKDITIVGEDIIRVPALNVAIPKVPTEITERLERFADGLGISAIQKLWATKVGIVGAGGTGSAAFHSFVRSCLGKVVTIDQQKIAKSNMERFHGATAADVAKDNLPNKVDVLAQFAKTLNPFVQIRPIAKNVLDDDAFKELIDCDVILGCTDSETGRLAISDIAKRFLIPVINVNVSLQGEKNGSLKSQYVHITRYGPNLPCPYCRDQVDPRLLAQELMSEEERHQRQEKAKLAPQEQKNSYWQDEPVLPTVGSLTTLAAEYAVNSAIGLLTGTFKALKQFLQFDLVKPELEVVSMELDVKQGCICATREAKGGQVSTLFGKPNGTSEMMPKLEALVLEK